jgi:hypothetical protein
VQDLRRIAKREGVNMDYLKNVILQYMTFPACTERTQLIPVISTLLQFNDKELIEVQKSTTDGVLWNSNTRPIIEIKKSLRNAGNNVSSRNT